MPSMIVIYAFIILFYILIDIVPLFKNKKWKEFLFYIICISISFILDIFWAFNIKLPSPVIPIERFITYILGLKD